MRKFMFAVVLGLMFVLGCASKDVSFNTLEDARGTARDNAEYNAKRYRATNPLLARWDLIIRGDSTQSLGCAMGDGWATIDFVSPERDKIVKVMCSTVSANILCLEKDDFKTKSYSEEDGRCQRGRIPFPLPKIAK